MAFLDIDNDGVGPLTGAGVALKSFFDPKRRSEKKQALEAKFEPVKPLEAGNFKDGSVVNALKYVGSGGREGSIGGISSFGSGSSGRLPATNAGGGFKGGTASFGPTEGASSSGPSDLQALISELLGQTKEGHTWESRREDEDMINQIFGSQLSAIANARDSTNSRFDTSLANTKDLYSGHVHDIRNADKASYQKIGDDRAAATNQTYDAGVQELENSRSAQQSASEEMLKRLGLEASAPVVQESANEGQKAIDALIQSKTAQQAQNNTYTSSDLTANEGRAQSIADESLTQQTDLQRQLQDILGELGNKEADVNSKKAEALYGARQNSESNWRTDREYATNSLAKLLEAQNEAASKSSELEQTNAPQIDNILRGLGITDPTLQEQYSSAYTDAVLNSGYTPGGRDTQDASYLKYLQKNNENNLDLNQLHKLVTSNLNYGTYKPGASG